MARTHWIPTHWIYAMLNLRKTSKLFSALAKTLATVLLIGGIGALIVVFNPQSGVKVSQANIVATEFAPRSRAARFTDSLRALGHGEPLALELNGGRIFSSSAQYQATPQQVLQRYQREFVRQRLNTQAWDHMRFDTTMQRQRASLAGELVPHKIAPNHIIMYGSDLSSGAQTPGEIFRQFDPTRSPAQTFSAYRWVEIYQEPDASGSTVFATWSDDTFDYTQMQPKKGRQMRQSVDPRVPICPNCVLVNQLADVGSPGTHLSYTFTTTHGLQQLTSFYRSQLEQAGWQPADETHRVWSALQDKIDTGLKPAEFIRLRRDDLHIELMISPMDKRTHSVRAVLSDDTYHRAQRQAHAR